MGRFDGRVAVITGGAAGIGRDSCLAFAREGASVAVVDVRAERAEQTAGLVREAGGAAEAFPCDVRDRDQVEQAVAAIVARFGRIDALFYNAGTTRPGDVLSVSFGSGRTASVRARSARRPSSRCSRMRRGRRWSG